MAFQGSQDRIRGACESFAPRRFPQDLGHYHPAAISTVPKHSTRLAISAPRKPHDVPICPQDRAGRVGFGFLELHPAPSCRLAQRRKKCVSALLEVNGTRGANLGSAPLAFQRQCIAVVRPKIALGPGSGKSGQFPIGWSRHPQPLPSKQACQSAPAGWRSIRGEIDDCIHVRTAAAGQPSRLGQARWPPC